MLMEIFDYFYDIFVRKFQKMIISEKKLFQTIFLLLGEIMNLPEDIIL